MADEYTDKPEGKAKPKASRSDQDSICKAAVERYSRWLEREKENVDAAYDDLRFRAGEQWPGDIASERENQKRPVLMVNAIPQFVRQVTGDMRQMKPSIKTVPVDNRGDKDTAETIAGMIRYVENRSDASAAYMTGADTQVCAGFGHWRVTKEYAGENTFNQELRIMGVDDGIAVAWDPDAVLPTREDAKWCIVPVDMSVEAFKENYPDAPVEDFDSLNSNDAVGWFDKDFVRVAEYWVKKPIKRSLALFRDGSIVDLTGKDEAEQLRLSMGAVKIEDRDSHKVCRYLITAAHVLEGPIDWPGMYIPIVPVIGEEVRIGRKIVRHGLIRFAKDPQRMVNYYSSAEAEVVALQPKAPWLGTEKNFEKYQDEWSQANSKAFPYLPYTPDSNNGGAPPSRVQPPVSSQGIAEGLARAYDDMKRVIGIYDAGLGQKSNETSGKAILARQREGDIGTFVYIDNWTRAIRHTGKILIDLIPHVYDTERMIRIMGEDGKVDLKWINKPVGMQVQDPQTGEMLQQEKVENDVTIGAYDVVLENGPSYTTKREEAKESMREFIQSAPETAPAIMDLYAKAQDWPMADEIGERLEAIAPPPIQQLIAKQKQEHGEAEQPAPPSPEEQQAAQMQQAAVQLELENKALANDKLKAEIAKIVSETQNAVPAQPEADPTLPIKVAGEQQRVGIDGEKGRREITLLDQALEQGTVKIQLMIEELQAKRAGSQQTQEKHVVGMVHGAEAHDAKLESMKNKPEPARPGA